VDAWFCGYQPTLVGISWIGFDQPRTLGKNQTGGRVALPIWMDYMGKTLKTIPEMAREVPEGVVTLSTEHLPAAPADAKTTIEFFYREFVPKEEDKKPAPLPDPAA
jgi:penicillin-binding protein 1A